METDNAIDVGAATREFYRASTAEAVSDRCDALFVHLGNGP